LWEGSHKKEEVRDTLRPPPQLMDDMMIVCEMDGNVVTKRLVVLCRIEEEKKEITRSG
jgi:hypothetical protein